MHETQENTGRAEARRDSGGIDMRAMAWVGIAIAGALALIGIAAWLAWHAWLPADQRGAPNTRFDMHISGPTLESTPQAERAAYMKEKERLLHSYQWIDAQAGIARIPIEQAMGLMAGEEPSSPSQGKRQ